MGDSTRERLLGLADLETRERGMFTDLVKAKGDQKAGHKYLRRKPDGKGAYLYDYGKGFEKEKSGTAHPKKKEPHDPSKWSHEKWSAEATKAGAIDPRDDGVRNSVGMRAFKEKTISKYAEERKADAKGGKTEKLKFPTPPHKQKEVKKDGVVSDAEKGLLADYNLEIVGDDKEQAAYIAGKVKEGIEKSADVCKISPPVCKDNKGIPRSDMPQLLDESFEKLRGKGQGWKADAAIAAGADPNMKGTMFDAYVDSLKAKGIKVNDKEPYERVDVGQLKATQREIKAGKTFSMADAQLKGEFKGKPMDLTKSPIVISKDGFILDGHHRFAAMTTIGPDRKMNVIRVDATMDTMLKESFKMPGVFRADIQDKVVPKDNPWSEAMGKVMAKGGLDWLSALYKDMGLLH